MIQLQVQLAEPLPYDLETTHLDEYKNLGKPWTDRNHVRHICGELAQKSPVCQTSFLASLFMWHHRIAGTIFNCTVPGYPGQENTMNKDQGQTAGNDQSAGGAALRATAPDSTGQSGMRRFMSMLCGTFDNEEQCRREEAAGTRIHPEARHIIGICNEKIVNLPEGFPGFFVIEESYFDLGSRQIDKHYLFLYEMTSENQVRLSSWNIPPALCKERFANSNPDVSIDYRTLEISPRFSPLLLEPVGDTFVGENVSTFSEDHIFKFRLEVTEDALYVTEALEKQGQLVAGYHSPVIYKKSGLFRV